MLLALRSRGGDELRAALATQLVRAMQAKAGLSDEEIHALEQPTPNPQLTNAVAAAVGAPVLPEPASAAGSSSNQITIGPANGGDLTANPNVNVNVHPPAPAPPRSPSSDGGGGELQAVPTDRLIDLATQPQNPLQGFAMRMLGYVERSAVAQVRKHEIAIEHAEDDHKRKAEHETALAEEELKKAKKMNTILAIKGTREAAAEGHILTPRLRNELSEQLVNNLAGNEGEALVDADLCIPKLFTAKAYAEHLNSGVPLTDAAELARLRSDAAQLYLKTFKVAATRVLPQAREGTALVCQFKSVDLKHRAFARLFAKYRYEGVE